MTTIISTFGYGVPGKYEWADDHATQNFCLYIYIYMYILLLHHCSICVLAKDDGIHVS